jgi:hypothetical protein
MFGPVALVFAPMAKVLLVQYSNSKGLCVEPELSLPACCVGVLGELVVVLSGL